MLETRLRDVFTFIQGDDYLRVDSANHSSSWLPPSLLSSAPMASSLSEKTPDDASSLAAPTATNTEAAQSTTAIAVPKMQEPYHVRLNIYLALRA